MHQPVDSERHLSGNGMSSGAGSRNQPAEAPGIGGATAHGTMPERDERSGAGGGDSARRSGGADATARPKGNTSRTASKTTGLQDAVESVGSYIVRNPLIATAAAFTIGAAVVMAVKSARRTDDRLDRRAMRMARNVEKDLSREIRSLRRGNFADGVDAISNSVGQALSKIDMAPVMEQARQIVDAARARIGK